MKNNSAGSVLVTLLVFTAMALVIAGGAVTVSIINTQSTSVLVSGEETLHVAESGIDNAVLRLLRDDTYTGETLTVGNGTATITVTGTTDKTITSVGVIGDYRRTVQAVGSFTGSVFTLSSWAEID